MTGASRPLRAFAQGAAAAFAVAFLALTVWQAVHLAQSETFRTPAGEPAGWSILWRAPGLALAGLATYTWPFVLAGSLAVGGVAAARAARRRPS